MNGLVNHLIDFRVRMFMVYIMTGIACTALTAQSPWLYPTHKGFYQIQSTFLALPYTALVDGKAITSRVDINRKVYAADVSLYFEYGLSNSWNVIGKIPFRYVTSGDQVDQLHYHTLLDEGSIAGLSNLEFALKRKLIDRNIKVATSVRAILNTTKADLDKGLITGYDHNALGVSVHIGASMSKKFYAFADLGYVITSNDFSDYYHQHIEGVYHLGGVFWARLTVDFRKSMRNGNYDNGTLIQTGLSPNDQEWIGLGIGLAHETKKQLGFSVSIGRAIQATYVGHATPLTLGIYKKG